MKLEIELPDYDGNAMDIIWDSKANCSFEVFSKDIIIRANAQGLIALAKQMLYMALNNLPSGAHVHYDDFITQNKNEIYELLIEKIVDTVQTQGMVYVNPNKE